MEQSNCHICHQSSLVCNDSTCLCHPIHKIRKRQKSLFSLKSRKNVDQLLQMMIVHGLSSSCKEGLPQALHTLYTHSQAANQKYLHRFLLLACGRYQQWYNIIRLEEPCVQDDCSHVAPCGVHGGLLSELSVYVHVRSTDCCGIFSSLRIQGTWLLSTTWNAWEEKRR